MLAQERFERILEILREKQSVTVTDLTKWLNTSESTIRRDLTELNRQGLLIKVHGGATAVKSVLSREEEVITKAKKHQSEKRKIGEYAASLINKEDMVYLDAGTTTEMIIDFLKEYDVIYVTNGITHARKLMNAGFKVHLIGGEIKAVTEAVVGEEALEQLDKLRSREKQWNNASKDIYLQTRANLIKYQHLSLRILRKQTLSQIILRITN